MLLLYFCLVRAAGAVRCGAFRGAAVWSARAVALARRLPVSLRAFHAQTCCSCSGRGKGQLLITHTIGPSYKCGVYNERGRAGHLTRRAARTPLPPPRVPGLCRRLWLLSLPYPRPILSLALQRCPSHMCRPLKQKLERMNEWRSLALGRLEHEMRHFVCTSL